MPNVRDLLKDNTPQTSTEGNTKSFDDEECKFENKKSLKINNSKSSIEPPPERIDVLANAQKILNDREFQFKLGWNLTSRLVGVFKNKKLQENKTQNDKDNEMAVLQSFMDFAKLINNDQTQEEGLGSITFMIAITRCTLLQRDQINEYSHELDILRKKVLILEVENNSKNK